MTAQPQPLDPAPIGFRPLTPDNFSLMHRWLNLPHVHEWWADGEPEPPTLEKVAEEYASDEPINRYVILYGATPVGYIQYCRVGDFAEGEKYSYPEFVAYVGEPDAANIDVFIGETAYLHRGLGPHLLRQFLREVVFTDPRQFPACAIDPHEPNTSAIRAYGKAGFRYVRTMEVPDEPHPIYLMRIERGEIGR